MKHHRIRRKALYGPFCIPSSRRRTVSLPTEFAGVSFHFNDCGTVTVSATWVLRRKGQKPVQVRQQQTGPMSQFEELKATAVRIRLRALKGQEWRDFRSKGLPGRKVTIPCSWIRA